MMTGCLSTTIRSSAPCVVLRSAGRTISLLVRTPAGHRAAAMYSLIETANLNGLDPQLYFTDVLYILSGVYGLLYFGQIIKDVIMNDSDCQK
jgi:hypothetical protein